MTTFYKTFIVSGNDIIGVTGYVGSIGPTGPESYQNYSFTGPTGETGPTGPTAGPNTGDTGPTGYSYASYAGLSQLIESRTDISPTGCAQNPYTIIGNAIVSNTTVSNSVSIETRSFNPIITVTSNAYPYDIQIISNTYSSASYLEKIHNNYSLSVNIPSFNILFRSTSFPLFGVSPVSLSYEIQPPSTGTISNVITTGYSNNATAMTFSNTTSNIIANFSFAVNSESFWTTANISSITHTSTNISANIINGNPAFCYYNSTSADLMYIRASDVDGLSWGSPVTIDSTGTVGQYSSLIIANGNPAVSYYDSTNTALKFARATDINGTAWANTTVETANTVGLWTSAVIANGNPAISYYDQTNLDLRYVRSSTPDGGSGTWGSSVLVTATGSVGTFSSMVIANGNPAICYLDVTNTRLSYIRSTDVDGVSWGSPITVDDDLQSTTVLYCRMLIIDNRPAIAYVATGGINVRYVRANDPDGSSWGAPVNLDNCTSSSGLAFDIIDGNPGIVYSVSNPSNRTKFTRSLIANGEGTWVNGNVLSQVSTATYLGLVYANNMPLIIIPGTSGITKYSRMIDYQDYESVNFVSKYNS